MCCVSRWSNRCPPSQPAQHCSKAVQWGLVRRVSKHDCESVSVNTGAVAAAVAPGVISCCNIIVDSSASAFGGPGGKPAGMVIAHRHVACETKFAGVGPQ